MIRQKEAITKMKITKRQLRRIIKEEKARLLKENVGHGIFNTDYIYDLLEEEMMAYSEGQVTAMEFESIRRAVLDAVDRLEADWVRR